MEELTFILIYANISCSFILLGLSRMYKVDHSIETTSYISFLLIVILSVFFTIFWLEYKKDIVIERSSDSEWVLSKEDIKRDTSITRIVIMGQDTLYPTTHYKVIKR